MRLQSCPLPLLTHYQGIGEYTDLDITPSKTSITFKDRFTAEKFMYGLPGGELPSVGKVDMAWVQTPLPPINPSASTSASTPTPTPFKAEDSAMDDGDGMVPTYAPEHTTHLKREHVENLDYDVADDNEWGIQ